MSFREDFFDPLEITTIFFLKTFWIFVIFEISKAFRNFARLFAVFARFLQQVIFDFCASR